MKPSKTEVLAIWHDRIKEWPRKRGKANLMKHLRGERLTMKEAIEAKCYDCSGGEDTDPCNIPNCSLIDYCPYGQPDDPDDQSQPDLLLGP